MIVINDILNFPHSTLTKEIIMRISKRMTFALLALTLAGGGGLTHAGPAWAEEPAATAAQANAKTFAGQVLGVSKKAKTISIKTAEATEMVKFTADTQGLEFAEKGEAAIIFFAVKDGEKVASEIKPKLAKLPEGASEIQPEEVAALIGKGDGFFLADSRPAKRYAEASLPRAVSVPIDTLKTQGESLLPADKELPLIFFCGGPT